MKKTIFIGSVSMMAMAFLPAMAQAQAPSTAQAEPAGGSNAEIIVTANKREQNLQDVPIAITAFNAQTMQTLGFKSGYDLAFQTPGFVIARFDRNHPVSYTTIRGIGAVDSNPINDPSVSYYVDEVYQAASFAGNQQLFDLERSEVLKGPQGTLFGRNASGGLVHFITKKPTEELDGYARLRFARFGERVAEAAIGGAVAPGIRVRLAGLYSANDGIDKNPITGEDRFGKGESYAGRLTVAIDLAPDAELMLSGHISDTDAYRRGVKYYGQQDPAAPPPTGARCSDALILTQQCVDGLGLTFPNPSNTTTYATVPTPAGSHNKGGYAKLTWGLGGAELVSLSAYEKAVAYFSEEYGPGGGTNRDLFGRRDVSRESFSQEFRLSGQGDWGSWIAGLYYFTDTAKLVNPLGYDLSFSPATLFSTTRVRADTDSYAAFGQVEYKLTSQLTAIGGLRYTKDKRTMELNGVPDVAEIKNGRLTGKAVLQWEPSSDLMTYLQYSRGYKTGGFGNALINNVAGPETVNAYELGAKFSLADGRLRFNTAAFYYDFKGLQAQAQDIDRSVNPPRPFVGFVNLDKVRIYGVDVEMTARPFDNLMISLGSEYLHSRIEDPDLLIDRTPVDNNVAPNAPTLTLNGIVRYDIPTDRIGIFSLQTDFRWTDDYNVSPSNRVTHDVDSYAQFNFRLLWEHPDKKFNVSLFLENAFDKVYTTSRFFSNTLLAGGVPLFTRGYVDTGTPKTWGIDLKYNF